MEAFPLVQSSITRKSTVADVGTYVQSLYSPSSGSNLVGFINAGTAAIAQTLQDRERQTYSVFDTIPLALQAAIRAGTSVVDVRTYIQRAHDNCIALGFTCLDWPAGTYNISAGLTLSPFVMHRSLGQTLILTALASGNFIHLSTQYGQHAAPYVNENTNTIVFIGQFYIRNTNAANTATAFYCGDVPPSTTYYCTFASFYGIEFRGWATEITYGSNAFDISWHGCFFYATRTRSINILSGAVNSGENMNWFACEFGGGLLPSNSGSVLNPNNVNGWNLNFYGCTFAYRSVITEASAATLTLMNYNGCHFEWDSLSTLFNHTGGRCNVVEAFYYSTSATPANPFIATVGANTSFNSQNLLAILPASVITLFKSTSSSGKLEVDYSPIFLGGNVPTQQEEHDAAAYIGYHGIHYDANGFVGAYTGNTTVPTALVLVTRVGNLVTLGVPAWTATSNATTKTITGMPAQYWPASQKRCLILTSDNGGGVTVSACTVGTDGVITMYAGPGFNNWTAAGTAVVYEFCFTYSLI